MKYLCLAYGLERDWLRLTMAEQESLLAEDDLLRERGDLVATLGGTATTVRAWAGEPLAIEGPLSVTPLPLVGFSVIEAANLEEAIRLVQGTPCARARGAIELRPILTMNLPAWSSGESPRPRQDAAGAEEPASPSAGA
jgi:hypothetical protein